MASDPSTISDPESVNQAARRGRPPVPPSRLLEAADRLFAEAVGDDLTMEAVATAAGVGKGTLFRAFGSREGLLDALWAAKLSSVGQALVDGEPPLGPGAPARERVLALLDALLSFKLENRRLIRAREGRSGNVLQTDTYQWLHDLLADLIMEACPGAEPGYAAYAAHVLLAALRVDVVEALLAAGRSPDMIRAAQAEHAYAVLQGAAKR